MSLAPKEQFAHMLAQAKAPLILLPHSPSIDLLASGCALSLVLEHLGRTVTLGGDRIKDHLDAFPLLTRPTTILSDLAGARDFVLSFNTEHNPILDIRTERLEKEVRISLTPAQGTIDPRDFSFVLASYRYDLIITLGAPDKDSLGKMYGEHPDLFFETPLINIDRHPENEHFGQLNLVDVTASSLAEIVSGLVEASLGEAPLPEAIAEALLVGILAETESFQRKNTTPRSLQIASRLMEAGADQQKIVKVLYKTQPLSLLKLLGRIMSSVRYLETEKFLWAPVTIDDLVATRSTSEDLRLALDKVRQSFSEARLVALFFTEQGGHLRLLLQAQNRELALGLKALFPAAKTQGECLDVDFLGDQAAAETVISSWLSTQHV